MRRVVILVFEDFQILDAAGPMGAFEMPTRAMSPAPYSLGLVSRDGGPVRSSSGVTVHTEAFGDPAFDTFLVAGGWGVRQAAADPAILGFVQRVEARRIGSVCSGAFVLAEAGLLDGRRAATHWRRAAELQKRHPRTQVDPDAVFVHDGPVWTSAGVTAGIDLALALIEDDLGAEVARRTAQELVVFHRRPGGQSQHSALLEMAPAADRLARALAFAREHLHQPLPVERLAEAAGLSPRQFARLFTRDIGQTPAKAVERLRVEAARIEVERRSRSLEEIARATGFGDAGRMRAAFVRAFGQPPQAMRRTVSD